MKEASRKLSKEISRKPNKKYLIKEASKKLNQEKLIKKDPLNKNIYKR